MIPSTFDVSSIEVDVTGNSTLKPEEEEFVTGYRTLLDEMKSLNPEFSSLEGNPHSELVNEEDLE